MNVRRGKTALLPSSLRHTTEDRGQIASTIWVEESAERAKHWFSGSRGNSCHLPTRLSTKLTLRSDCRTRAGGQPPRAVRQPAAVRLAFCRNSAGTASASRWWSERRWLTRLWVLVAARLERQNVSHESESDVLADIEESSDDWEAVSDHTDVVEMEATELIAELYGAY